MKRAGVIGFVIYLIFALYFLNVAFGFVQMPEFISGIQQWINLIGAILIAFGGINFLRASRRV